MDYMKIIFLFSYIYEEYKRNTAQIRIFESRDVSNIEYFPVLKSKFAVLFTDIYRHKFRKCPYESYLVKMRSILIINICMFIPSCIPL